MEKFGIVALLAWLSLTIFLAIGWVMNIVQIFGMTGFSGKLLLKIACIFVAPIGGILGWIG